MDPKRPKISIVTVTYNRAHLIERSIESILKQTYDNWELILVNNGSTDNTQEVLDKYKTGPQQHKIRIFHLEKNRKFAGGTNFGLDQIQGEWFTLHDDDDEIVPEAIETLMHVPLQLDPSINAITCNCLDTTTQKFSGFGMEGDGYLSFEKLMSDLTGEFWGITKVDLLGNKRLNEQILGYEDILWNKIDKIANRYYIHKPLRTWYTNHGPTITRKVRAKDTTLKADTYRYLLEEPEYLADLKLYRPIKYRNKLIKGLLYTRCDGDTANSDRYLQLIFPDKKSLKYKFSSFLSKLMHTSILKGLYKLMPG